MYCVLPNKTGYSIYELKQFSEEQIQKIEQEKQFIGTLKECEEHRNKLFQELDDWYEEEYRSDT